MLDEKLRLHFREEAALLLALALFASIIILKLSYSGSSISIGYWERREAGRFLLA
jgi:hypothetical protein